MHKDKSKVFLRSLLYAHPQFLCSLAKFDLSNRGVLQPVMIQSRRHGELWWA